MKLKNIHQVEDFLATVDKARDDVWLVSPKGDEYNLKSAFTKYIAMGELLSEHGDELELFCSNKADEGLFIKFYMDHPGI